MSERIEIVDTLTVRGHFQLLVTDHRTGRTRVHADQPNLVTDLGRQMIRDILLSGGFPPTAIALGTDSTTPAVGDTSLGTEVFRGEISRGLELGTAARFYLLLGTGDANGNTLREAGLTDSTVASQGNLLAHVTFADYAKTSASSATVVWTIQVL